MRQEDLHHDDEQETKRVLNLRPHLHLYVVLRQRKRKINYRLNIELVKVQRKHKQSVKNRHTYRCKKHTWLPLYEFNVAAQELE